MPGRGARRSRLLFLVHMGMGNLRWTRQPCWVSAESRSVCFNPYTFRLSVRCKRRPGNLDPALLQVFLSFPCYCSFSLMGCYNIILEHASASSISFPFAIHDINWKFHRTKAHPMDWLKSTILILDSCKLMKTTAGFNFVFLFNLKILFVLA